MSKTKQRAVIVGAAIMIAIAVAAVHQVWFPGRPFDRAAWTAAFDASNTVRAEMADRMIARRTLLGKSRADVVAMLGDPSTDGYFNEWDLVYWLGPERGFIRIDSEWLVLRLGADGRVAEHAIMTD